MENYFTRVLVQYDDGHYFHFMEDSISPNSTSYIKNISRQITRQSTGIKN